MQLATSSGRPGSIAARCCHAAGPSLPPPATAPRSASLADNSAPATPRLRATASPPLSLAPSPQPDSVPGCSIPFSPIGVPPVAGTLNGDISNVQSRTADTGQTGVTLSLRDGLWHGSLRFVCGSPDFGGLGFKVANC